MEDLGLSRGGVSIATQITLSNLDTHQPLRAISVPGLRPKGPLHCPHTKVCRSQWRWESSFGGRCHQSDSFAGSKRPATCASSTCATVRKVGHVPEFGRVSSSAAARSAATLRDDIADLMRVFTLPTTQPANQLLMDALARLGDSICARCADYSRDPVDI